MATYKVLQDIEAEDKFVGPLTLKQFILGCITLITGYLCVLFLTKDLWILDIPILPILLFSGFLAFPWGRDQPTETWLLAKIRFALKPRRRIWDQTGMKQLVTITAPRHMEEQFVGKNLSQTEVKSRLKALADTIDSRGWAIKNVNVNLYADPGYSNTYQSSDRLVDASTLAHDVPTVDINASDDILDEHNNPTAHHLDEMITTASQNQRQAALQQMQDIRDHKKPAKRAHASKKDEDKQPPADFWFMNQTPATKTPKDYTTFDTKTVLPGTEDDLNTGPQTTTEEAFLAKRHKEELEEPVAYGHTKVIEPLDHKPKTRAKSRSKIAKPHMTRTPDPGILNLAKDDDKSVATIARMANQRPKQAPPDDEVVISLR